MIEVLENYIRRLNIIVPISESTGGTRLQHIRWMCERTKEFIKQDKLDKANRWLGFIQGVLWTRGIFSIDEIQGHNK